jgi:hypothetical protein
VTAQTSVRTTRTTRVAVILTELFAPIVLIFALLLAVAVHSTGSWTRGLLLGAVAAFFAGGMPYLIMLRGIRGGQLNDRHLRLREQRPRMMAIGLISASLGLGAMVALGAPRELFGVVAAMVAGVAVALIISSVWKISIHTACVAGTIAVLAVVFGPPALWLTPLIAAIAWARVHLQDHTMAQVIAGATVGALVAAGVMALLV